VFLCIKATQKHSTKAQLISSRNLAEIPLSTCKAIYRYIPLPTTAWRSARLFVFISCWVDEPFFQFIELGQGFDGGEGIQIQVFELI
jgi:hypothetical protein